MKKGHCIICRRDEVELSDEHVIPDAIGGYYHIYNVCKNCNSNLGNCVDSYLLKHWLIIGARHNKRLAGKTNKIPNPLIGDGHLEDGTKVRMEEDKSGKLAVRILPKSPEISPDGKTFSITVDAKDEKLIEGMKRKAMKKLGISLETHKLETKKNIQSIPRPWVKMQTSIDIKNYKIGLLKIAYEFAVDKYPDYYKDPMALLYSEILHNAAIDRLDEVAFEGDGILQSDVKILEDYIDYGNADRHVLILINYDDKLYCMVKLFQNTMCQLIRMSDKKYGNTNLIVALNDFVKHECKFYNEHELIKQCIRSENVGLKFSSETEKQIQAGSSQPHQVNLACNMKKEYLFFDANDNCICTQKQLVELLESTGNAVVSKDGNKQISKYNIPDGYFLKIMPSGKLVKPESIIYDNEIVKL